MIQTIGLDLDNTIFDLEPIYKMGFKNQTKYKYTSPTSWEVYKCYPKEIADKILAYFRTEEVYKTPLLNLKYATVVRYLQNKYNVKIVTSRVSDKSDVYYFGDIYRKKVSWVRNQTFNQLVRNNIFIPMDDIIQTNSHNKIDEIISNKVDLMIDDSPITVENCLKNNIDCIMISTKKTPYNHYLRNKVEWYKNLFDLIRKRGL